MTGWTCHYLRVLHKDGRTSGLAAIISDRVARNESGTGVQPDDLRHSGYSKGEHSRRVPCS